jgi:DNA modification methylase
VEIEHVAISSLIPYARNSRTHTDEQTAQIAASIKEFGFTNPVLIDADGGIIAGHGRVLAARKLKLLDVPCLRLSHLTETQKRAYVIADNKLALNAGWDAELLAVEFADLSAEGFDLELTGFTLEEIDALTPEVIEPGLTDEDYVPEVQPDPITKPGDVWLLGKHRVMCGDSTSIDAVDILMDGKKADLCFTSPPYNLGDSVALRNGARKGKKSAYNDFNDDADWSNLMVGFINNAMLNANVVCVNVQMLTGNKFDLLKLFSAYSENTIDIGIWSKTNPPPAMADGVMNSAFEFMWFLSNEEKPNRRIKTANFDRGTFSNVFSSGTASGHDASVHGAVFPSKIAEHYVSNCSPVGSLVLDLFGGTGTTLIACEKTGREARLMELDPKYVDVIVRRWQEFTGKQATHAATGATFSEVEADSTMAVAEAA